VRVTNKFIIRKNHYFDSVALMRIAAELEGLPGVRQATAIMATEANLELAAAAGLVDKSVLAQPNDLLIAVAADDDDSAEAALALAQDRLDNVGAGKQGGGIAGEMEPRSIAMALERNPEHNLVLISCPGEYAAAEARKALNLGLNVMMFSDNVAIEDEVKLKQIASGNGLMMMGPDCGTAIINGVPFGFANVVKPGAVGVVAASGTGMQQVTSLLSQWGVGISQAIGTGGRDLKSQVGGITMIRGLEALAKDSGTEAIVLISKPPSADVAEKVISAARAANKPVVVNFLGVEQAGNDNRIQFAETLEQAAVLACSMVGGTSPAESTGDTAIDISGLDGAQKYLRGVYSGGTFCYEAQLILRDPLGPVWSSTPVDKDHRLADSWTSREHTVVDLGDDEFTQGRPHPMIDHRTRHERILQEAADPETAVILFDVVLGHGAHADPAGEIAASIEEARVIAGAGGRKLIFVGFVCGTDLDPQNLARQVETLQSAGVVLEASNAAASRRAASLIQAIAGAA
jgi:succinyl-CoA synthetase alpha subunit